MLLCVREISYSIAGVMRRTKVEGGAGAQPRMCRKREMIWTYVLEPIRL